jgi:hypothetical protein
VRGESGGRVGQAGGHVSAERELTASFRADFRVASRSSRVCRQK